MNRLVALPLLGYLTVVTVLAATGGFEGVPTAVAFGWVVVGALGVLGLAAGFSFARGRHDSDEETEAETEPVADAETGPEAETATDGEPEPDSNPKS